MKERTRHGRGPVMRRCAPVLAGMAAASVLFGYSVPLGPLTLVAIVALSGGLGALALLAARRTALPEPGWSGPTRGVGLGPSAQVGELRARPPAWRVAAALGRVEARELALSPWFGVGIGLLLVSYLSLGIVWGAGNGEHWAQVVALAPWFTHPLVGMAVVAAHRGVTRARRDGADELFDTCPSAPTTRTWGSVAPGWVPVVACAAFLALYSGTVAVRSPNHYGSVGADAVAVVLAALALGIGGVVLGVALGRWVRFPLAPVVAVAAVGFLAIRLATIGDPGWNHLQQLSSVPPVSNQPPIFSDDPAWAHLAWVVALTLAVLVVAVARHRRDLAVGGLAASLLVAATGLAATRPMPGPSADRIAGLIAAPAEHQVCVPAGPVPVCAYPGLEELSGRVVAEVTPVAMALPTAVPPLTLRQRYPGKVDDLPPEVARRLPSGIPPVPPDEVALGYDGSRIGLREQRFRVALRAMGLPVEPDLEDRATVVSGQARGVVALWLASRGLGPTATRQLLAGRTARDGDGTGPPDAFDRGYAWPSCLAPVVWSAQDLRAARALAALPESTVQATLHQGWERWRDQATGTDELLAVLGQAPVGPFDAIAPKVESPHC